MKGERLNPGQVMRASASGLSLETDLAIKPPPAASRREARKPGRITPPLSLALSRKGSGDNVTLKRCFRYLLMERVCGDNPTQMFILMENSKSIKEET